MVTEHNLKSNLERILKTIGPNVKVVGVTKNRSLDEMEASLDAGITIIGENRIQEAQIKFPQLKRAVRKHLIGHLQTNKVKIAVELFDMIESIDSIRLAEKINEIAKKMGETMPILLQVNIAKDANKFGFFKDEIQGAIQKISTFPHLKIQGLMAIIPYSEDPKAARPHFRAMKNLFDSLKENNPNINLEELSMGMSHDYAIAVEEGATMVRIGRALFE